MIVFAFNLDTNIISNVWSSAAIFADFYITNRLSFRQIVKSLVWRENFRAKRKICRRVALLETSSRKKTPIGRGNKAKKEEFRKRAKRREKKKRENRRVKIPPWNYREIPVIREILPRDPRASILSMITQLKIISSRTNSGRNRDRC